MGPVRDLGGLLRVPRERACEHASEYPIARRMAAPRATLFGAGPPPDGERSGPGLGPRIDRGSGSPLDAAGTGQQFDYDISLFVGRRIEISAKG